MPSFKSRRLILIVFCFVYFNSLADDSVDSLVINNDSTHFSYRFRTPISLTLGMGVSMFSGDATDGDKLYNDLYVKTGTSLGFSASIPIPYTKIFGLNLHYFSIFSTDESLQFGAIGYEDAKKDWLPFDPNGQYGIEDYLDNALFYTGFVSAYPLYEMRNTLTMGPSIWIPLGKKRRALFYASPMIGKGKFVQGKIERSIEETLIISIGDPVFRATTEEQVQTVPVRELTAGFLVSPGKHFCMRLDFSHISTSNIAWKRQTDFFINEEFKQRFTNEYSMRFEAFQISIHAGIRF